MGRFIVFILILVAAAVWITQVHPVFAVANSTSGAYVPTAPLSFSLAPYTADGVAAEQPTFPVFDGDGVVFTDTSSGTPGTPYLAYENPQSQALGIKELLFLSDAEGNPTQPCQITAGEYPCARDINGNDGSNSDASPVPSGTPVHIIGSVDDQGIVVQSLEPASTIPSSMVLFSTALGSTVSLSNGTTIAPIQVMTDASCTLGVGCYGNGTPRLETTISFGNSTTTTELIPGTVFIFQKSAIILISVSGGIANFLVSAF